MCDINFTGCARVLGAELPAMIVRGTGQGVITGSLSGRGGVRVQLANPGFIATRLTAKNDFQMPFLMQPEQAAAAMMSHMEKGGFKTSFPIVFSWLFRLSQFLPDWAYYRLFAPRP